MDITHYIITGLTILTGFLLHREFTWRVRGRNRRTIGYMIARVGDMGEEYRNKSGAWSVRSGAIYMQKSEAEIAITGLDSAYLVPLRLDPRKKIFIDRSTTHNSDVFDQIRTAKAEARARATTNGQK